MANVRNRKLSKPQRESSQQNVVQVKARQKTKHVPNTEPTHSIRIDFIIVLIFTVLAAGTRLFRLSKPDAYVSVSSS